MREVISNIFKRSTLGFMSLVLALSTLTPLAGAQVASAAPIADGPFSVDTVCEGEEAVLKLVLHEDISGWTGGSIVYKTDYGNSYDHWLGINDTDEWSVNTGAVAISNTQVTADIYGARYFVIPTHKSYSVMAASINCDKTSPTATFGYVASTPTNTSVVATITANEDIQVPAGWTAVSSKVVQKSYAANTTEDVTIMDLAGNSTLVNIHIDWIDTVKPGVTLTNPQDYVKSSYKFVIDATDGQGLQRITGNIYEGCDPRGALIKSTSSAATGTNASHTVNLPATLGEGTYGLVYNAQDTANNTSSTKCFEFTIDNTAPTITNVNLDKIVTIDGVNYTGASLNGGYLNVTFNTNEPLKLVGSQIGFSIPGMAGPPATGWTKVQLLDASTNKYVAHIDLTNRTDTSSANYTADFFEGKTIEDIRLYFRTVDALGNTDSKYYLDDGSFGKSSTNAFKFTLDNTASNVTLLTDLTNPVRGLVDLKFNVDDGIGSGVPSPKVGQKGVYYKLINSDGDTVSVRDTTSLTTLWMLNDNGVWTSRHGVIDTTNLEDGVYVIEGRAIDNAGNTSVFRAKHGTELGTLIVDNTKPKFQNVDISSVQNNSTRGDLTISLDIVEPYGVDWDYNRTRIVLTGANGTVQKDLGLDVCTEVSDGRYQCSVTINTDTLETPDGMYHVTIQARDMAGNFNSNVKYKGDTLRVDNTEPDVDLVDYATNGNVITPNITATDLNGPLTYSWSGSNPNVILSATDVLTPDFTVAADGSYSFDLTVTDAAGNSTTKTFSFVYAAPVDTDDSFTDVVLNGNPSTSDEEDVLGTQTENNNAAADTSTPEVKGASDSNVWKLAGLAWYWWLLVLAILAFIGGLIAALRRRHQEND